MRRSYGGENDFACSRAVEGPSKNILVLTWSKSDYLWWSCRPKNRQVSLLLNNNFSSPLFVYGIRKFSGKNLQKPIRQKSSGLLLWNTKKKQRTECWIKCIYLCWTMCFSELYVVNAPLLRAHFRLSVCLSVCLCVCNARQPRVNRSFCAVIDTSW